MMKMKALSEYIPKQITLSLRHLSRPIHSDFSYLQYRLLFETPQKHFIFATPNSLFKIFKIELLPPLEITPVIEITINRTHNPTINLLVLAPPPEISDKATR